MFDAEEQKPKRRKRKRKPLRMRRIMAKLTPLDIEGNPQPPEYIHCILNDISLEGIGMFSHRKFPPEQTIEMEIVQPVPYKVKAEVRWCDEILERGKIISSIQYPYRLGLKFILDTDEAKQELEAFCIELVKRHILGKGLRPRRKKKV